MFSCPLCGLGCLGGVGGNNTMTRGTSYIILDDKIIKSCEFNGDMYKGGHYEDMTERLKKVNNEKDFEKEITAFDLDNFQNQNEKSDYFRFYKQPKGSEPIDMSKNYIQRFFSDYLFWKNISDEEAVFIDRKKKEIILAPGKIATFCFGKYIETI